MITEEDAAVTQTRDDHTEDGSAAGGTTRRGFIRECMAWAGTGLVWTVSGGVLSSRALGQAIDPAARAGEFSFAQISDTHIGFNGDVNRDVAGPCGRRWPS
jgi:3',5'-cyclic-AMP phosphodiesterase